MAVKASPRKRVLKPVPGEYVIFLDADDVLLPSCIATHIFVHLSLRIPVGFSSADMIQSVDSRMVLGTIYRLSEYVRSGRGRKPDLIRRIDESAPEVWPLRSPEPGIENQVHLILPSDCDFKSWFWAPTSCNCFRRDALQLFFNNEHLGELLSCTDAYLLRGVSLLMGSVVIDRALAIYRLHGMNVFSKHPNLYGMLSFERGGPSDNDMLGRRMVIDHLFAKSGLFLRKLESTAAIHAGCAGARCSVAAHALDGARLPDLCGGQSWLPSPGLLKRELGLFNFVLLLSWLKVAPHVILLACLRRNTDNKT